jgi:hypothetical protein
MQREPQRIVADAFANDLADFDVAAIVNAAIQTGDLGFFLQGVEGRRCRFLR